MSAATRYSSMAALLLSVAGMIAFCAMIAPFAQAQQAGNCCQGTQSITVYCQSQNCHGSVSIDVCTNGGYGKGVIYPTLSVTCCTSKETTLGSSDGACNIATPSELVAELPSRLVWVRNCQGSYVLQRIAHG